MRAEHDKLLFQDVEAQDLLAYAATRVAHALVPPTIAAGVAMARLTAFRKPDAGVRGIATGDAFRRLVALTLALQWALTIDQATRPFQFAMQSRAGTDGHAGGCGDCLLNCRRGYDSISRGSFLAKLREVAPQFCRSRDIFMDKHLPIAGGTPLATFARYLRRGLKAGRSSRPSGPSLDNTSHESLARAAAALQPFHRPAAFLDGFFSRHGARLLSGICGHYNLLS